MSQFYEKVATPEARLRQSKAPSGPERDVNARQEAQNDLQNGLGASIMNLIGAAQGISNIVQKGNDAEKADMIREHSLDAKKDTRNYASGADLYIDKKARENDKDKKDLTEDELELYMNDYDMEFFKEHGSKPYSELIKEEAQNKRFAFVSRQSQINKEFKKETRYEQLVDTQLLEFNNSDDSKDIVKSMQETLDKTVGEGLGVEDTHQNAKMRMLQKIIQNSVNSRDYKMLKTLKSKEMSDFFDMPDYKNAVNVLEKQTQSKVNQLRQTSFDKISDQVYLGVDSGAFSNMKEIDSAIDEQLNQIDEEVRPYTKDIMRLKARLSTAFEEQLGYEEVKSRVESGDTTFMKRTGIDKKTRDVYNNKMFQDATGLDSLDPQSLSTAILSGDRDAEFRSAYNTFGTVPPAMKLYGEAPISGGINGMKQASAVYQNLSVQVEGTPVTLDDIYKPERQTELLYVGRLLDDADAGVISEADATQAFRNFQNDIKKNRDGFGNYVSPSAQEFLNDDETKEWLQENVTDASWTTDEQSAQGYRRRQLVHYFNLAMETTDDSSVAREKAEQMFSKRHRDIEAPNGEEVILPSEYMEYDNRDFLKIANNHPDFEPFRSLGYLGTGVGKETYFENSISFTPDANYEKNKVMNLYYGSGSDKKLVMSVTPKIFDSILNSVNGQIIQKAKQRRQQRVEEFKNK